MNIKSEELFLGFGEMMTTDLLSKYIHRVRKLFGDKS